MSAWPKSRLVNDSRDSLAFRAGNDCAATRPACRCSDRLRNAGLGAAEPERVQVLRTEHKMNGQQVGQLQQVTTRSQRKVAGASRGTRELCNGFRPPFFSD